MSSYKKLSNQLIRLKAKAKTIAHNGGTGSKAYAQTMREIRSLTDQIKSIDAKVAQHNRTTGNY